MIYSTSSVLNFVDIDSLSLVVNLDETSDLLIMFSGMTLPGYYDNIYIRAVVGQATASPSFIWLTPTIESLIYDDQMFIGWESRSYNFHMNDVAPGTYTVKIQWCADTDASIADRTLSVLTIPST